MSLRISSIETIPVALPFRETYETAAGSLERREMLILRITSSNGGVGYGDAVPLSLRGGPSLAAVRGELDGVCRSVLESAELDTSHPPAEAGASIRPLVEGCVGAGAGPGAASAVDIALLDLLGRAYGVPAWIVLGATAARPVYCNATLGAGEPQAVAAAAEALIGEGFGTLKVKVGAGDDLDRMRAVRSAAGPEAALRIDANGAWNLLEATRMLDALGQVGIELAEQPCPSLEELATLRRRCQTPIVADESVSTVEDADRAVALEACDAVTLKLAKVGGPHAALRVASRAPAYLSSALDSSLGIAAALHTAQALPAGGLAARLAHGLATAGLFADDVADAGALRGPAIEPTGAPGLGIEIDEAALERLRIP